MPRQFVFSRLSPGGVSRHIRKTGADCIQLTRHALLHGRMSHSYAASYERCEPARRYEIGRTFRGQRTVNAYHGIQICPGTGCVQDHRSAEAAAYRGDTVGMHLGRSNLE